MQFVVALLQLLVQLLLFYVELLQLLVEARLGHVGPEGDDRQSHDEHDQQEEEGDDLPLYVYLREVGVQFAMDRFQLPAHPLLLAVLHLQQFCVADIDHCRVQQVVALKGLPVQDAECQLRQLQALGGIDIGGLQDTVQHKVDAAAGRGQCVHPVVADVLLPVFHRHLPGAHGQSVVVSEQAVDVQVGMQPQDLLHGRPPAQLRPVAQFGGDQLDVGIVGQCLQKASVALNGGRRPLQSCNLHQGPLPLHLFGDEVSHGVPDFVVVGSHVGSVFVAVGLPVEEDDGDAPVVGLIDDGGEGGGLVGSHDEQVHLFFDEMAHLFYLPLVVVFSREELQVHVVVGIAADGQLAVLLVAPDVLAAL